MIKNGLIFALIGLTLALWLQVRELQSRSLAPSSSTTAPPSSSPSCPSVPVPSPCASLPTSSATPSKFVAKELERAKSKMEARLQKIQKKKERIQALASAGNRQNLIQSKLEELYRLRLELNQALGLPPPAPDDLNPDRAQQKKRIQELQAQLTRLKPPQPGMRLADPEKEQLRNQLLQEVKALEQENHSWKEVRSGKSKKNEAPAVRELRSRIKSVLEEVHMLQRPHLDQDLRKLEAEEQKWKQELLN